MKLKQSEIDFYIQELECANELINSFEFPTTSKALLDLIKKMKDQKKKLTKLNK